MDRNQDITAVEKSTIAILGGGFTGATLAAQLLRHWAKPLSIVTESDVVRLTY